jgi:hypothetical protein
MGGPSMGLGGPPMGGPSMGQEGQLQQKNTIKKLKAEDVWSVLRNSLESESDGQKKED